MLMSLTWPSSSVDLANLDLGRRSYTPEGVHFMPRALAKQSKRGKPLQGFFFLSFTGNELLCPVKDLRDYGGQDRSITRGSNLIVSGYN